MAGRNLHPEQALAVVMASVSSYQSNEGISGLRQRALIELLPGEVTVALGVVENLGLGTGELLAEVTIALGTVES